MNRANIMSDIQLSVIIVSFKSNGVLANCLNSIKIFNDIGERLEIIVVDNFPWGAEAFANISSQFPRVKFIDNPENGGFGQANNIGARIAKGKYLLFLNPDTELLEPIFKFAIHQFQHTINLAAFGMLLYDRDGKACNNSFGKMPEDKSLFPSVLWWPAIKLLNFSPKRVFPLGADLFISKEIFQSVGGFDEGFFLCYEEPDLIRRLPKNSIVKIFNKKIMHLDGHTTDELSTGKRLEYALDSERYFFSKHKLDYKKYAKKNIITTNVKIFLKGLFFIKPTFTDKYLLKYYKNVLDFTQYAQQ